MASGFPTTSNTLINELAGPTKDGALTVDRDRRKRAWRRFVDLYGPVIYRLGKRKGLTRERADDATQNFLLAMIRELKKFQFDPQRGKFRSWICTIALTEIYKVHRADRRAPIPVEEPPDVAAPDTPTEDWIRSAEAIRVLQLACEELRRECKERDFEVFRLLALEQRSGEDVASLFGMTRNQVYSIKFRMLARLRILAQRLVNEIEEDLHER